MFLENGFLLRYVFCSSSPFRTRGHRQFMLAIFLPGMTVSREGDPVLSR